MGPSRCSLLNTRFLALEQAIQQGAPERLYHSLGGASHTTADGIKLLRRISPDIPVYLVRLEAGFVQRLLHQVSTERISEGRLIEQGVTGYAAAFEEDRQRVLVIVSRAPLQQSATTQPVLWRQRGIPIRNS